MLLQMALFHFFMAEEYSIVYMYHILFICSSVDGHSGWFHVLAIVNSAEMSSKVHTFFKLWFSPDVYPGVGLLDHMVALFLVFKDPLYCSPPVLLPEKSHGQRRPLGCSPWGCWESDPTEQLRFHFSLACIGEGNGNPLQCSCLENPRDRGAWWAAVSGVTQSRTRLNWLSSSSSILFSVVDVPVYIPTKV